MQIINFFKDFDEESFDYFKKQILDIQYKISKNPQDNELIYFYLDSCGGEIRIMNTMVDMINNWEHRDKIIMIPLEHIFSAGLYFFLKTNTKKRFLSKTIGMAHIYSCMLDYRSEEYGEDFTKISKNVLDEDKKDVMKFLKDCGFSKKEFDILEKKDYYFSIRRLKDICKKLNHEII